MLPLRTETIISDNFRFVKLFSLLFRNFLTGINAPLFWQAIGDGTSNDEEWQVGIAKDFSSDQDRCEQGRRRTAKDTGISDSGHD